MRMQLSQQAADLLGQSELVIITERVDDVGLLIGQMVKMGLPEILDRHIGVPGVISGRFSVRETATKSLLGARHDYI